MDYTRLHRGHRTPHSVHQWGGILVQRLIRAPGTVQFRICGHQGYGFRPGRLLAAGGLAQPSSQQRHYPTLRPATTGRPGQSAASLPQQGFAGELRSHLSPSTPTICLFMPITQAPPGSQPRIPGLARTDGKRAPSIPPALKKFWGRRRWLPIRTGVTMQPGPRRYSGSSIRRSLFRRIQRFWPELVSRRYADQNRTSRQTLQPGSGRRRQP